MREIILKHGEIVLVDDENFEELNRYKWCLNSAGYATRRLNTHRSILMHRFIMNTPEGLETDHINGNKLDNRVANLRNVTHSQNQLHHRLPKTNTSGVKGVVWDKKNKKWQAQIKIKGKNYHLGRFKSMDAAIMARSEAEAYFLTQGKIYE